MPEETTSFLTGQVWRRRHDGQTFTVQRLEAEMWNVTQDGPGEYVVTRVELFNTARKRHHWLAAGSVRGNYELVHDDPTDASPTETGDQT